MTGEVLAGGIRCHPEKCFDGEDAAVSSNGRAIVECDEA